MNSRSITKRPKRLMLAKWLAMASSLLLIGCSNDTADEASSNNNGGSPPTPVATAMASPPVSPTPSPAATAPPTPAPTSPTSFTATPSPSVSPAPPSSSTATPAPSLNPAPSPTATATPTPSVSPAPTPTATSGVTAGLEQPPLRPDGRFFRDATNRVVILQGVFSISKPVSPDPDGLAVTWPDYGFFLESLGMNSVRLGYHWSALEPERGSYDLEYLETVRQVVDKLSEAHIFTLIDSHQDLYGPKYGSRANGFPEWSTIDNGLPYEDVGFPAAYFTPAVSHAFDNLWLNTEGILDAYTAQLGFMAAQFNQNPYVMGYDLMNEPWPGTQWPSCFQNAGCPQFDIFNLQPAMDQFAAAVRAQDDDAIVFYEPQFTFDSGAKTWLNAPPDELRPIGFSFHDLCVMRALRQIADEPAVGDTLQASCDPFDTQVYINAFEAAIRMDATPFATEVLSANERDTAGLGCLLERAEDNKMSWNVGQYPAINNNNQIVLARVFPRATAGIPQQYRFDVRSGRFSFEYLPDHSIDAPTLIAVPVSVHYPDGYLVEVEGAEVISEPNAVQLLVRNNPAADVVNITVIPAPGDTMERPDFAPCRNTLDEVLDLYDLVFKPEW